jgi:VanZ family protein
MQANSFLKYNWPSILWAAFILYLCMMPARHLPHIPIPNFDKLVHFTFYFTLSILMNWGWLKQQLFNSLHKNALLKIFLICCAYGFTIEIMQETLTTDRHFEWLDEAANATGAAAGSVVWMFYRKGKN